MFKSLLIGIAIFGTTPSFAGWNQLRTEYIRCESHNYRPTRCEAYSIRRVEHVRLVQQHSKTRCEKRYNWDATRRGVEVWDGCRGTFAITGW